MKNRRILIVDDNLALHEDFKKILSPNKSENVELREIEKNLFGQSKVDEGKAAVDLSFDLEFAQQGEEALKKALEASARGQPFALIFMDVRMPPGWDGIETVKRIWKELPDTEVVICTAYSDYSIEDVQNKLGLSDRLLMLKKPFDTVEVQQAALALTAKWNLARLNRLHTEHLEELVEAKTKELDAARARSANTAKLAALGEMAGGVAHEINNPLAIISANGNLLIDLMKENFDQAMGLKLTEKIVSTTERIAKIIRGLKAFSRSGENDPLELVSMKQLIDETLGICTEKFRVHDIEMILENTSSSAEIECRSVQLIQVLLNLLNNAYDAIEGLPEKWVKIEIKELPESVEIAVTDSGSGLPKEVKEKIFQPFFTTKEIGKGTGLGLSISKGIVESHKGKLRVNESCPNTQFLLSFPRAQSLVDRKVA